MVLNNSALSCRTNVWKELKSKRFVVRLIGFKVWKMSDDVRTCTCYKKIESVAVVMSRKMFVLLEVKVVKNARKFVRCCQVRNHWQVAPWFSDVNLDCYFCCSLHINCNLKTINQHDSWLQWSGYWFLIISKIDYALCIQQHKLVPASETLHCDCNNAMPVLFQLT